MPIKKCQTKGKKGYKAGDKSKCYIGKLGKKKAIKQMDAIAFNRKHWGKPRWD